MGRSEDDFNNRSLKEKLLSPEDEKDLARRARSGDEVAFERFCRANLRLVSKKAGNLHRSMPWVSESDLIQDGYFGLRDAVTGYNPEKGYRFSTYAVPIIMQRMMSGVSERTGTIYIPEEVQKARAKLKKGQYQFYGEFGHFPTHFELCEYLGIGHNMAKTLEKLPRSVSMEAMRQSRRSSILLDRIPDDSIPDPLEATVEAMKTKQLSQVLKRLSKKKRDIILRSFGFINGVPESLASIATKEGVTRACLSLRKIAIIEDLRGYVSTLQDSCLFSLEPEDLHVS